MVRGSSVAGRDRSGDAIVTGQSRRLRSAVGGNGEEFQGQGQEGRARPCQKIGSNTRGRGEVARGGQDSLPLVSHSAGDS